MTDVEDRFSEAASAYYDNADWADQATTAKAKIFRTAVTRLIGLLPSRGEHAGESQEFDLKTLKTMLDEVNGWIAETDAYEGDSGGAIHYDLSDYRTPP